MPKSQWVCAEHRGHVIRVEIMISFRQPSIKGVFTHVFRITRTSILSGNISGGRREINQRNIIGNVGKTRTHRVLFGFLITYRDANIVHTDTRKCIQTNTMWSVINTLKHIMIYYNVISPYASAATDCCPVKYEQYCIIRLCILNFCFVLLEYNNNDNYCYYPPDGNAFGLLQSMSHDT